ncbi:MAG: hypothetical protein EZS28_030207 [Streblomastix strix]|uniref:Uncharacterized protein n=1 Tax=Streblomastix strix TaxID=222440 RepID=A0A5J4UWX6_9EUKA|nr:MAG: hypothetical protein EZS28_030207 [Streblomastix strix]
MTKKMNMMLLKMIKNKKQMNKNKYGIKVMIQWIRNKIVKIVLSKIWMTDAQNNELAISNENKNVVVDQLDHAKEYDTFKVVFKACRVDEAPSSVQFPSE